MKVSREWLQRYFDKPLPNAVTLADALTFHAFEIESVENDILDVKVTPNRGHDCLSHRGIARELSAILQIPMKSDPLRQEMALEPECIDISIHIEDAALCPRYIAAYIKGVKVGPSPEWLRKHLESIGQKSINNIVDATNFVMFDLGQPLHAFDASKLAKQEETYAIGVRNAKKGEKLTALDEKEYTLDPSMLAIMDAHADISVGIAGVKGGQPAGITEATRDIIIESANFNGVSVRKTAHTLRLRTDASQRFEQVLSPELAAYGMQACAKLIEEIACGEVAGFVDEYPEKQQSRGVSVDTKHINAILGSKLSDDDVSGALARLDLPFTISGDEFTVKSPFERLDLSIPEDIAEEVGRIIGYDKVPATRLAPLPNKPEINKNFYAAEQLREAYVAKGYSEVYTSVFVYKGERVVANKVDGVRPYLRGTLIDGLRDALEKNGRNKDLLGVGEVKLFEIGTVWRKGEEVLMIGTADFGGVQEKPLLHRGDASMQYEDLPLSQAERYQPFSKYPFIVRDISMWVPQATNEDEILRIIHGNAGELLVRLEKFDEFKKGERISYAFRLVFQSFDRTLTDTDANQRMESISEALKVQGFEIR